jgi:hypothetical protein
VASMELILSARVRAGSTASAAAGMVIQSPAASDVISCPSVHRRCTGAGFSVYSGRLTLISQLKAPWLSTDPVCSAFCC